MNMYLLDWKRGEKKIGLLEIEIRYYKILARGISVLVMILSHNLENNICISEMLIKMVIFRVRDINIIVPFRAVRSEKIKNILCFLKKKIHLLFNLAFFLSAIISINH